MRFRDSAAVVAAAGDVSRSRPDRSIVSWDGGEMRGEQRNEEHESNTHRERGSALEQQQQDGGERGLERPPRSIQSDLARRTACTFEYPRETTRSAARHPSTLVRPSPPRVQSQALSLTAGIEIRPPPYHHAAVPQHISQRHQKCDGQWSPLPLFSCACLCCGCGGNSGRGSAAVASEATVFIHNS